MLNPLRVSYNLIMNYIIAIDGPVASGKGTVARILSRKFGIVSLDTGALYRGITVYLIDNKINDEKDVIGALDKIDLSVKWIEGSTAVFLNGADIAKRIRDNAVSVRVAKVSPIPAVRDKVRQIQAIIASNTNLVCEGRDITSVVFPNARFKFYIDASVQERAKRRFLELKQRGQEVSLTEIEKQIADRDHADMTRVTSPLVHVKDAVKIDASRISAEEVAIKIEEIVTKALLEEASK